MSTIKKIANVAGVSVATVSYVLNGKESISPETRDKVLDAAHGLSYLPGQGRGRRKQLPTIGKKLTNVSFVGCLGFSPIGEAYFGQMLKGCLDASNESLVTVQVHEVKPEAMTADEIPLSLRQSTAEGLILTGVLQPNILGTLSKLGKPIVLLDIHYLYPGFSHVRPDNFGGILKALQHLNSLGHKRIGVIAGDLSFACEVERLAAYHMGMMQLGLPFEEDWIVREEYMSELTGYQGMKRLLSRELNLSAVLCFGDLLARGAITAAHEAKISIPFDMSIVGFDNQAWTAKSVCPITTVDTSLLELGRVAFRHLKELVVNPKSKAQRITVEAELVVRQSTAPFKG
jgi:LacI family transcriptional regulator